MAVTDSEKVGLSLQNRDSYLVIIIFLNREIEILKYEPMV